MSKKIKTIFAAATAFTLALSMLAACADNDNSVHRHAIYPIEAKAATCTDEGIKACYHCIYCGQYFADAEGKQPMQENEAVLPVDYNNHTALVEYPEVKATCSEAGVKAYSHCADCGKYYIDGKEVSEADLALAIDPSAHNLVSVAEVPAGCVTDGVKAHKECSYCGKLFTADGSKETTAAELKIDMTGVHNFGEADGDKCLLCDGYKVHYDSASADKYAVVDGSNKVEFAAASVGASHTDKKAAVQALLKERMTFSTQTNSYISVKNTADSWNITFDGNESPTGAFTRFAVADSEGKAYNGKFVLTFDVTLTSAAQVKRLGIKVIEGEEASVVKGGTFSKLLGTDSTEENNSSRTLVPNVQYRMQYLVETTADNQLVQIFTDLGATTAKITNLHVVPLKEETASGKVSATLLSFGQAYTTDKTDGVFGGTDFFAAQDWTMLDGSIGSGADLYDRDGNLVFTHDTAARFNLFYVAETNKNSFIHLGDKGDKGGKIESISQIYGKAYSYTFTMSSTGAFDLLVLGASNAKQPASNQNGMWLSFANDGKIGFNIGSGNEGRNSWEEISGAGSFVFGADKTNTVTVTIVRKDATTVSVALSVNGKAVAFAAENIANKDYVSLAADGAVSFKGVADVGYGMRAGFMPAEGSTVTVSDISVPASGYLVEVGVNGGKIQGETATSKLVEPGTEVTVTAEQQEGYTFMGWQTGGKTVSENLSYTFKADRAVELDAVFKSNAPEKHAVTIDGKDFFDISKWENEGDTEVVKDKDNNLVFSSISRFNLFQVTKNEKGQWTHLADKGNSSGKMTDAVIKQIGDIDYSYTFEMSATGAFKIQLLGISTNKPFQKNAYTAWLSFEEDGTLTIHFGHYDASKACWGELSCKTDFAFGADKVNTVTLTMNRESKSVFNMSVAVNDKTAQFAGKISDTANYSFKDGVFTVSGIFNSVGYGSRIGFMPSEGKQVIISGAQFPDASGNVSDPDKPQPAPVEYTVKVEGGTIKGGSQTSAKVEKDGTVTVVAAEKEGYTFAGWYNGETKLSDEAEYSHKVTGDITLTAKYNRINYTVTVSGGTIKGQDKTTVTVEYGTAVTVVAADKAGYTFEGWSDGSKVVSKDKEYTFTPSGNVTLTAQYKVIPDPTVKFTITVENGKILGAEGTSFQFEKGAEVTVETQWQKGKIFKGWSDGSKIVSNDLTYIFEASADVTLTATFENVPEHGTSSYKGDEFFNKERWDGDVTVQDGKLVFTADKTGRFDLTHVAQTIKDSYIHIADKEDKTNTVPAIYGKAYSYSFELSATGAFDILLIGTEKATTIESAISNKNNSNGLWLSFAKDGSIMLNYGSSMSDGSWNEVGGTGSFVFGADKVNMVTVTLTRNDADSITVQLSVNGKAVNFAVNSGVEIASPETVKVENGAFTYSAFNGRGYGQRVGFYPAEDSTVTVSDVIFPASGYYTQVSVSGGTIKGAEGTSAIVEYGSEVTVVAEERGEYQPFAGWYAGEDKVSDNKEYTFKAEGVTDLEARYTKLAYKPTFQTGSANAINGKDFFNLDDWADDKNPSPTKSGDSLQFTNANTGRFDLFHIAQDSNSKWVHLGDNAKNEGMSAVIEQIKDNEYTFSFEVASTGAFDILVLGSKNATNAKNNSTGVWLSFADDGTLTFNFGNANDEKKYCWGELSCKTDFKFGADKNTVNIVLSRKSNDLLEFGVAVNGKIVEFSGTITNTGKFACEDGTISITGIFGSVGYGQRVGFYPAAESTVTVSGLDIAINNVSIYQEQ